MSDGSPNLQNKTRCPGCGNTIKSGVRVCPSCTLNLVEYERHLQRDPTAANDLIRQATIRSIKSLAGLNAWSHPVGQIAICAQVDELSSATMGLRKGLLVRPGTRAILVKDGKLLDALESGSYQLSNQGLKESGLRSRLADLFKGSHHCEIYLVDAGEFRVRMGESNEREEDSRQSEEEERIKNEVIEQVTPLVTDLLLAQLEDVEEVISDDSSAIKEIDEEIKTKLKNIVSGTEFKEKLVNKLQRKISESEGKHGVEEKLKNANKVLDEITKEFQKSLDEKDDREDLHSVQEYFRDRRAKLRRFRDRLISEAVASKGLLRLKTREGYSAELCVDLYFQVDGNMDFVNNVLRGRTVLREQDLVEKIHGPLQNVLQSVVLDIAIDDLYGNMDIREHIRNAAKTKLAPTFSAWGLRLYRVEGFTWNLGVYEEYLAERADLDLSEKTALLDAARRTLDNEKAEAQQQNKLNKLQREAEIKSAQGARAKATAQAASEVGYVRSEGQERIKDLEHGAGLNRVKATREQEIGLDRKKRTAQIEAMRELQAAQLEKRAAELRLAEAQRDAEHRRGIERLTAETEARLKAIQIQAGMSPEQILALAASQRPELIPALQAYAAGRASQTQVDLMEEFHKRLQEVFGTQQEKLTAVMEYAFQSIGNTVQGVRPQIIANPQHGQIFVTDSGATTAGVRQESGRTLCGCCGQVILPEPLPEDRLCGGCRKLGDEKPCN